MPNEEKICTCASFFTVRGYHKKDCPAYEEKSTAELENEINAILPWLDSELDTNSKMEKVRSIVRCLCSQQYEKGKQEGREQACDYIDDKMYMWSRTELDAPSVLRKLPDVIEAARKGLTHS